MTAPPRGAPVQGCRRFTRSCGYISLITAVRPVLSHQCPPVITSNTTMTTSTATLRPAMTIRRRLRSSTRSTSTRCWRSAASACWAFTTASALATSVTGRTTWQCSAAPTSQLTTLWRDGPSPQPSTNLAVSSRPRRVAKSLMSGRS